MQAEKKDSVTDFNTVIEGVFGALIGQKIYGYEIAQIMKLKQWSNWADFPVHLRIGTQWVSIRWHGKVALELLPYRSMPVSMVGTSARWINTDIRALDRITGHRLQSARLVDKAIDFGRYSENRTSALELCTDQGAKILFYWTADGMHFTSQSSNVIKAPLKTLMSL